uniref:Gag-pol polyprotein n=1 Tax=Cannabis sativa TaxID=3483 RepID=A0A803QAS4_CANSA
MTVKEYATKFDRLEKIASDEVATKVARKAKFIRGLDEHIAWDVIVAAKQPGFVRTYAHIVELALATEGAEDQIRKKNIARRDSWKQTSGAGSGRGNDPGDRKKRASESSSVGPNKIFQEQKKDDTPILARVFILTQAVVDVGPSIVTGQLSIAGTLLTVLIDSGAMHSYVLVGSVPSVFVEGRELSVDLIELNLEDFDVILGMDWLAKYNATIDCKRKMVTFQPEGEDPFVIVGRVQGSQIPSISALKARYLLCEGSISFLANVVDTKKEPLVGPEHVPVV